MRLCATFLLLSQLTGNGWGQQGPTIYHIINIIAPLSSSEDGRFQHRAATQHSDLSESNLSNAHHRTHSAIYSSP